MPTPSPREGEVLVRVRSSSVNGADVEIVDGFPIIRMTSPFRPANRIAGTDVAGVVERTGPGVTDLRVGDEVPIPGADDRSVHSEVEFMSAIAAATDVAVPALIRDLDGELVTLAQAEGVPEPRECVVFGRLGGPDLAAHRSPGSWAKLGGLMGTMHRFAEEWTPLDGFRVAHYDSRVRWSG